MVWAWPGKPATPEGNDGVLQRLKRLCGVGGQLPFGLPPELETLEYTAGPVVADDKSFGRGHLDAAADAISRLKSLKRLTVGHCSSSHLPLGFVARLPTGLQVLMLQTTPRGCACITPDPALCCWVFHLACASSVCSARCSI
jgi:hypothetical protein